nr:hypothetical protein [Mycobacterium sp. URHB0044]
MNIVPAGAQRLINRVDRQPSLVIAIGCGLLAFWSVYRMIWSLYLSITYNFLFGSFVFSIVFWGVIGAVAAMTATGFLTRYKAPEAADTNKSHQP